MSTITCFIMSMVYLSGSLLILNIFTKTLQTCGGDKRNLDFEDLMLATLSKDPYFRVILYR